MEVHWVWSDPARGANPADLTTLSNGERQAWVRLLPDVRRQREAARGALRRLLGMHLGIPPDEVEFAYGPFGKPRLARRHRSSLAFSVSHSGGWSVIALVEAERVGIDIERIDSAIDHDLLAVQVMSPTELRNFRSLPEQVRCGVFYRTWVAKEAVVKAVGCGLSQGLADVEVLTATPTHNLSEPLTIRCAGSSWSVTDLKVPAGLTGVLVVPGGS